MADASGADLDLHAKPRERGFRGGGDSMDRLPGLHRVDARPVDLENERLGVALGPGGAADSAGAAEVRPVAAVHRAEVHPQHVPRFERAVGGLAAQHVVVVRP